MMMTDKTFENVHQTLMDAKHEHERRGDSRAALFVDQTLASFERSELERIAPRALEI